MTEDETGSEGQGVHSGYAGWQMARALMTSEVHEDAGVRERARAKVRRWMGVIEGMVSGRLAVGARQPMAEVPVWATPEVLTGGFATGRLLAGGPLGPHEVALAMRVGVEAGEGDREKLNAWFLSEAGFEELRERLGSGCYEVEVPEEAALLMVVWLASHGAVGEARALVDVLRPHFGRLRFYPKPSEEPMPQGPRVFLECVGTVLGQLRRIRPNRHMVAQRESIGVWTPLYEEMVGLFLDTVEGDVPTIEPDAEGRWASPESRRFYVVGGWPCREYARDWRERAGRVVAAIERSRAEHKVCGRPDDAGDSFARLFGAMRKGSEDPASLTGREVGMIRLILARHVASRGLAGSREHEMARARQMGQITGPMHHEVAGVVVGRMERFPADGGVDDVAEVVEPVTAMEAERVGVAAGTEIPASIVRKAGRCLCDTVDVLMGRGIVTSGDTLARLVPQFTASLRASAFDDPQLRVLFAATYRAFRRRRSLLLLNLEKQVPLEELPWVAAMERRRGHDVTSRELSRRALKEVAAQTLRAFPQAIIPNKLLQEFRALAKGAGMALPFVEELAADIFMDDFSPKFTEAAKQAAAYVDGTLYARYYGLDCGAVMRLPDNKPGSRGWAWSEQGAATNQLAALCIERAAPGKGERWDVARNGMVIEQSQILTTHNLALLFGAVGLEAELRVELRDLAERCFRWICRRMQVRDAHWHARLITLKQTAYAWRQMIFFVSRLPDGEAGRFMEWAEGYLGEQGAEFHGRFGPALRGLAVVQRGLPMDEDAGVRRFLGWTQGRHWLAGDDAPKGGMGVRSLK